MLWRCEVSVQWSAIALLSLIANQLLVHMAVFPHPARRGMYLSVVMKAASVLTTFSLISRMARCFFLPVFAGSRHVPLLCHSRFVLPQLRRIGCLSRNMRRWTQTATSPPHYGKFRVSCNSYSSWVTRKGGLIACSACIGRGQCHLPAGLGEGWAVAAGRRYTCAVRAGGRLCLGQNAPEGQCDVPADLGPVWAAAATVILVQCRQMVGSSVLD